MSAESKAEIASCLPSVTSEQGKTEDRGQYKVVTDFPLAFPEHLEIRIGENKGRGLYTTKTINPGDTIIATLPLAHILNGSKLSGHCSACCREGSTSDGTPTDLKSCTSCKVVKYCDSECQAKDWPSHRKECKAFQRCAKDPSIKGNTVVADSLGRVRAGGPPHIPGEYTRALGRVMWKKQSDETDPEVRAYDLLHWCQPPDGEQQVTKFSDDLARYLGLSRISDYTSHGLPAISEKLVSIDPDTLYPSEYAWLALGDTVSRFTTNAFVISDDKRESMGLAISPLAALLNHSCAPNAAFIFPWASPKDKEPCLKIIAHKKIRPGEEVLLSYTDTTVGRQARQAKLERFYQFTCKCTLCEGKMGIDPREVKPCDEKGCDGFCPYPSDENPTPKCLKCGADLREPDAIKKFINLGCDMLNRARALQDTDARSTCVLTDSMLTHLQTKGFPPSSHPMLAFLQQKLQILRVVVGHAQAHPSSLSESAYLRCLDDLVKFSSLYTEGLRRVLNKGHPVRAYAMMGLAQDLAHCRTPGVQTRTKTSTEGGGVEEKDVERNASMLRGVARLKEACETMAMAVEELAIGFGKDAEGGGGLIGKQARQLLEGMKRELRDRE